MRWTELLDWLKPKTEELEDILKEVKAAELIPGATYMMVVNRNALSQQIAQSLGGAFKAYGLKPPIVILYNYCGGDEIKVLRIDNAGEEESA